MLVQFFDVYLYTDSPVDSLSLGPKTGELVMKSTGRAHGIIANLFAPGTKTPILEHLRHVRLVAMNSGSFVIEGTRTVAERPSLKSKTHSHQEQWVIKHVGAPAIVDAKRLQKRSAARLNRVRASGFDPKDDG